MDFETDRESWASMTHGEKLFFVVASGSAASFAYSRLHLHHLAAHSQMARIKQAIAASKSIVPEPSSGATQEEMQVYIREGTRRMQSVLSEVHFYFVSWSGCRNMLKVLVGQPEFLEAKKVFDSYRKDFEHYVAGRNSFEHFHDRLLGQEDGRRDKRRVKEVQPNPRAGPRRIYSGLSRGKYVHSNLEWDISPKSLEQLDKYIGEVLTVVHAKVDEEFNRKFMSA